MEILSPLSQIYWSIIDKYEGTIFFPTLLDKVAINYV